MAKLNKTEITAFSSRIYSLYSDLVIEHNNKIKELPAIQKAINGVKKLTIYKKCETIQKQFEDRYTEVTKVYKELQDYLDSHRMTTPNYSTLGTSWMHDLEKDAKEKALKENGYMYNGATEHQIFGYVTLQMYTNEDINKALDIAQSIFNGDIDVSNY